MGWAVTFGLTIVAVLAATAFYAVAERWLERVVLGVSLSELRTYERMQIWALRIAGIWLTFWLLAPAIAAQRREPLTPSEFNAQQISRNGVRLDNAEARIAAIESLRLDTRLALVEDTREEVRTMRQWLFGIFGGVAVTVVVQLLQLLGRSQQRRDHHSR